MRNTILTFDLGTSYFKVCLFDESLRLVAHKRVAVPVEHPAPGRAELPVVTFEHCLGATVRELARQVGLQDVQQICFASQANSFTLLDRADRPLLPFVLWTDQRARVLEPFWNSFIESPAFYATTGIPRLDHHFMVTKLAWLHHNEPNVISRVNRLSSISDYLVFWLTGAHAAEMGLASLTGIVDIQNGRYWHESVSAFPIERSWLPELIRAGQRVGPIRSELRIEWGLAANCSLVMGCLDQYAGAIGAGVTNPNDVCETTGTVLSTVRCANGFKNELAPGVFQGPSIAPGIFYQMLFSRFGAGLLESYRNHLPERPTFAELDRLAAEASPNVSDLQLHRDAPEMPAAEMFVGRSMAHHRGKEVRAIMERIARELLAHVKSLCVDAWPSSIHAVGGAARSQIWLDIKSEILGCPVIAVDCPETTSLGAARLAANQASGVN